jgi:hypothetical protein
MRNEVILTDAEVKEYFDKQRQPAMHYQVLMVAQVMQDNTNNMNQDATNETE